LSITEETLADYRILAVRKFPVPDVEKDFEWVCRTFGFLESRDKKRTAYRVFRAIVEATTQNRGVTSDELAEKYQLSRGTMVYHLNKLTKSGLIIHHEGQYKLRGRSLKDTITEVQRDVNRIFEDLQNIAESIDNTLGLASR